MDLKTYEYVHQSGWSNALDPAMDSEQTLVIVFGPSSLATSHPALNELFRTYPSARFVGCSTAGEIFGSRIQDDSLAVAIIRFEHATLQLSCAPITAEGSYAAGESISRQLLSPGLRTVFVLSDGLQVNGSELLRGIGSVLPRTITVFGGLAADADRFSRTWIIKDRALQSGCVSAVGLYGDGLRIGHGSKGGWDSFGVERLVTRSDRNVLYELDGQPALQLYKEYLGDRADGLPATGLLFPLALRTGDDVEDRLVRTILAVDEAAQSLTFAGDIPQGSYAQLMHANFDRLIEGAGQAALSAILKNTDGAATLAVAISCVGRRLILGQRAEEETEATLEILPPGTQQIGFYSYGEISPFADGRCDLHNQTMTLTTISEA